MAKITKIIRNNVEYSLGGWDMSYSNFNWVTKTWAVITLDLASKLTPTINFTINAPSTIQDGQTYVLRVDSSSLVSTYTMTLWTNISNPYGVDTTLTAGWIDQFVFLAINWTLELQPELGWSGGGAIVKASNSPIDVQYVWAWTSAEYTALSTKDSNTIYFTTD